MRADVGAIHESPVLEVSAISKEKNLKSERAFSGIDDMKRVWFCIVCICSFLMLTAPVFGAVEVAETDVQPEEARSFCVRILDDYEASPDDGDLILFFSHAKVSANHEGDIYVFFGDVQLEGAVNGTVYTLSGAVSYPENEPPVQEPIIGVLSFISETSLENGIATYTDTIPNYALWVFWLIVEMVACLMIYPIKPGFMEQGAVLMMEEPVNVLRNGLTVYFFCLALMFIFGLTVFLLPVSIGIFAVMQGAMWVGEVAIAVAMGRWLARQLKREYAHGYMVVVLVMIGLLKSVPYVSVPMMYVAMPVLSLGLVTTNVINGWIHRRYYETPFCDSGTHGRAGRGASDRTEGKKAVDISAVRDILIDKDM